MWENKKLTYRLMFWLIYLDLLVNDYLIMKLEDKWSILKPKKYLRFIGKQRLLVQNLKFIIFYCIIKNYCNKMFFL